MPSHNRVELIGRLSVKPELHTLPSGTSVTTFSVATNEVWNDKKGERQERTEWHRVVAWGRQAELVVQHLDRGHLVFIAGRLRTREYRDKDQVDRWTTEINILPGPQSLQFLDRAAAKGGAREPSVADQPLGPSAPLPEQPAGEDNIPF
jgi:single-strand DNA-binding protein